MIKKEVKNLQESVYHRLRNIAHSKKRPTQEVLRYYAMERFLYRLSISEYRNAFFLKGGLMLMVWSPSVYRPTRDIDLLGKINNSIENITNIIKEICAVGCAVDGILFDIDTLSVIESQLDNEYRGVVVQFFAHLFTAKLSLRIDIGFSDTILPHPVNINYPILLDFPIPQLRGYTPETSIAEKLDTIIRRGRANTRMKDFYDIWVMLKQFQITQEQTLPLVSKIFQHRETPLSIFPEAFLESFYTDPQIITLWEAFLRNIEQPSLSFQNVVLDIKAFFIPLLSMDKK